MLNTLLSQERRRQEKREERPSSVSEAVFLGRDCWGKVVNHIWQIQWRILTGTLKWLGILLTVHLIPTSKIPNVLNFLKEGFFLLQFINVSKCGCMANHSKFTLREIFFSFDCSGSPFDFCMIILSSLHSSVFKVSLGDVIYFHGFDSCWWPSFTPIIDISTMLWPHVFSWSKKSAVRSIFLI